MTAELTVRPGETPEPADHGIGVEQQDFSVLVWMSEQGVFVFTASLLVFAGIFIDGFASVDNITDVFNRAAPIGIVAVGMTFVVISANYLDLSVVAQVATSAVLLIAVSNSQRTCCSAWPWACWWRSCTASSTASPSASSAPTP